MKKKIILLIALFMLPINILGLTYGGCDYSIVSILKSLVTNINIHYDYHIENNTAYFDVTLTNITPDMYFYDPISKKNYYYNDTNNGEITISNYTYSGTTGIYKFYSAKEECYGITLGSKYYKLPSYNKYYNDQLCSGISNYSLCQKWTTVNYSREEFETLVNEYKNQKNEEEVLKEEITYEKGLLDKLINFYVNYYYYLLSGIIIICGIVIVIKRRKDRFKL